MIKSRLTVCPPPVISKNDYSMTCAQLIAPQLAYPKSGSDLQEALNLLNKTKVCHFEPIHLHHIKAISTNIL